MEKLVLRAINSNIREKSFLTPFTIYEIEIVGLNTEVHKTSFEQNRSSLPQSIAIEKTNKWSGARERHIGEEINFYKKVDWKETENIRVQKLYHND